MRVYTIGHGRRPAEELVACLREAGVRTLVDVRRIPRSRRNPQFSQDELAATVEGSGFAYRHAEELGGLRSGEPGEERFACLRIAAFRSYAARMGLPAWQDALAAALAEPSPCFMCAETSWLRCHRRMLAELLAARSRSRPLDPSRRARAAPVAPRIGGARGPAVRVRSARGLNGMSLPRRKARRG